MNRPRLSRALSGFSDSELLALTSELLRETTNQVVREQLAKARHRLEAAGDAKERQAARMSLEGQCSIARASQASVKHPPKTECLCLMRHVCACVDPECVNGSVTAFQGTREVVVRCRQCPEPRKDEPRSW